MILYYELVKRVFDLTLSICVLILFIPLWVVICFAIKMEDPTGQVLFKQRRVGLRGSEFTIYKFRTMVVDAEKKQVSLEKLNEQIGPIFKIKKDPRITSVGHVLRKTSLDEFPQLLNVLKGEMSLIGPRPLLPKEVAQFSEYQQKRFSVKPGCTGLWQVSGRSNLNFIEMIKLDLQYINDYGAVTDFKIFFKTLKILITMEGAY